MVSARIHFSTRPSETSFGAPSKNIPGSPGASTRRTRRRPASTPLALVESLEPRMLLSASVSDAVATSLAPRTGGQISAFQSNASVYQLSFYQFPTEGFAGQPLADPPIVLATDLLGAPVGALVVTLSKDSGPGNFQPVTSVTNDQGLATFSGVVLDPEGVYTLKASVDADFVTSSTLNIVPWQPTRLFVTQQPLDAVAGKVLAPTIVELRDSSGNLVIDSLAPISVRIGDGNADLLGTLSVVPQGGVATFSDLQITKAGTYKLEFSDAEHEIAILSVDFTISPAAAYRIVMIQSPTKGFAEARLSPGPQVAIQDVYGNVLTTSGTPITISLDSGPQDATLTGTLTVNTQNGVSTFGNITPSAVGTYTLRASAPGLGEVYSGAIVITPAPPVPIRPVNLSPANLATGIKPNVTLSASPFNSPSAGTHASSQWVIRRVTDNILIFDSGIDSVNLTSIPVLKGLLANGTRYAWSVRYRSEAGIWSPFSATTSFTTSAAAAPIGSIDVANRQSIAGWGFDADAGEDPVMVRVDIDGFVGTPFLANLPRNDLVNVPAVGSPNHGFQFVPPALSAAASHTVALLVQNSPGGEYRQVATATIPAIAPGAPTDLAATALSSTSIKITWKLADNYESGVFVKRWNGATWANIAILPVGSTSYTDNSVAPSTQYYYNIVAANPAGETWALQYTGAKTPAPAAPGAPTNLAAVPLTANAIKVTWSLAGGETQVVVKKWNGAAWLDAALLPAGSTTFTDTGLAPNTRYYYNVVAVNAVGGTWAAQYTTALTWPAAPPAAASNLAFTQLSNTSGRISWNLNGGGETAVQVAKWTGSSWQIIAALPAGSTSFVDPGLWLGGTFYYMVATLNNFGQTWSASYLTARIV